MSWPSILIRTSPKETWYREIDGVLEQVAPPTYRFFGEDHEGRGIYRVTETKGLLATSGGHSYSWIPRRTFITIPKDTLHRYSQVVIL